MKPLLLALLVFGVMACGDTVPTISLSPPESVLAGPTWKRTAYFDAYDGVWHSLETTRTEWQLRFFGDGTFAEQLNGRTQQAGTWQLNAAADTLTLRVRTGGHYDARYHVRTLTPERLELARMGRHGLVIDRYRPR